MESGPSYRWDRCKTAPVCLRAAEMIHLKMELIIRVTSAEQTSGSPLNMLLAMAPHGATGLLSR